MRVNIAGWFIIVLFLGGGVAFTIAMPEIWIGQIWIGSAILVMIALWIMGRGSARLAELRRNGIAGRAYVLEATQTGTYVNRQPLVKLALRVELPGIAPFTAEKRQVVPLIALGRVSSGMPIAVYADRKDHGRFALDWSSGPATPGFHVGSATTSTPDLQARLDRLDDLHERALISDTEYANQRARILGEI